MTDRTRTALFALTSGLAVAAAMVAMILRVTNAPSSPASGLI